MEAIPPNAFAELVIAACGPLVNVVIALVIFVCFVIKISWKGATEITSMGPLEQLFLANVGLVIFNLLPVYPMDGGRIARAILQFFVERDTAIGWTARLGQILAACFALYGLFTFQISLMIIFGIMFMVCTGELLQFKLKKALREASQSPDSGRPQNQDFYVDQTGDVVDADSVRRVL